MWTSTAVINERPLRDGHSHRPGAPRCGISPELADCGRARGRVADYLAGKPVASLRGLIEDRQEEAEAEAVEAPEAEAADEVVETAEAALEDEETQVAE